MKTSLRVLLILLGISCFSTNAYSQNYSGGSGTKQDPFLISNKADLKYLSENSSEWDKYFLQTADIGFVGADFEVGGDFYNGGEGFIPIAQATFGFEGGYDGGGYIIDSLYINQPSGSAVGLFARSYTTDTIKNLGLSNVNITGFIQVGGLVGQVYWGAVIDCYVDGGTVNGDDRAGGLTGSNLGLVRNCYSTANVSGLYSTGGLAGEIEGSVYNSYAMGNVLGDDRAGGLAGYAYWADAIVNCYSTGGVTGSVNVGGLTGQYGSIATNCYWDTQTSGLLSSPGGTGKTTIELQSQATFVGWDFAGVWKMGNCITNDGYPILHYQTLNTPTTAVNFSLEAVKTNEFCSGGAKGEIDLTVIGTSTYTYAWGSGDYTEDVTGLSAGTYSLIVTDQANCGTIDTTFVIDLEPFFSGQTTLSASSVCLSGSSTVELNNSSYGAKYWLRDNNTDTVVDGPVIGNGGTISFTTDNLTSSTDFNVLGASLNSGNSIDTVAMAALEFTGNADAKKVSLGQALWTDNFEGNSQFTVEAWVNRSSAGTLHTIVSNYTGSYPLLFRIDNDKITLYVNSAVSVGGTSTIPVGVWTHLAGTYDGSTLRVFVNGVEENATSYSQPLIAASDELRIGGGISNGTEYFVGSIADVRFWNVAKSENEIAAQMNEQLSGTESGLVANYQFTEGSGIVTSNSVSVNSSYMGTLVNSPAWVAGPIFTQVLCSEEFLSVITVEVGSNPDTTLSTSLETITVGETGAIYQWVDCNNANAPIGGEVSQSYTATNNGNYAVIVSNGSCEVMSTCVEITSADVSNPEAYTGILVYPNPSHGELQISVNDPNQRIVRLKLFSILGTEVLDIKEESVKYSLNLADCRRGIYLLEVTTNEDSFTQRVILE